MDCNKFVCYDIVHKPLSAIQLPKWLQFFFPIQKTLNKPTYSNLKGIKADNNHIYKYISYNNFENFKTKIPEGAKLRKKQSPKFINEVYCGNKVQPVEDKHIIDKYKNDKFYYTHDNGARPFCVYINKAYVDIYKILDKFIIDFDTIISRAFYSQKIASLNPLKVFIGISSGAKYCDHTNSNANIKFFTGNSILVQIAKFKYIYIGSEVYEFDTKDDHILKYYSAVGNNDVPYPVSEGNKYIYFMQNGCFRIEKAKFPKNVIFEDAYSYYYNNYLNKVTSKAIKNKAKDIQKLKVKYLQKRL